MLFFGMNFVTFQGIEVELYQPDNIFVWSVKIRGLRHTIWEGQLFVVKVVLVLKKLQDFSGN